MRKKFYLVKNYYDKRLWSIERVRNAVVKEYITPDEFNEITGENNDGY
ncbi:MAG: XkdX family protein [Bacteroidales bacterium]|nr:XkdX family protein [Bacteroidales bacterium]